MDIASIVAVAFWLVIVVLVAVDDARRETRHDDVDALAERKARELAGRDV